MHQSKMKPCDNKFHKGNGVDKKHYWLTPPDLYQKLDKEFNFDFDPCPVNVVKEIMSTHLLDQLCTKG